MTLFLPGQLRRDAETVADGLDGGHAGIVLEQQDHNGYHDDGDERTGNLLVEPGHQRDNQYAQNARQRAPQVDGGNVLEVGYPLLDEVGRHRVHAHAQQVLDLCGENGDGNTAGEPHHDGIGYVLDDGAQPEHAQQDEEHARHERGNGKPLHAILLDDAIDDDDESTRRTAYLNLRPTEGGNHESGNDGRDDALFGRHARGNAERNGQRKRHDADDDTGHEVGHERRFVVMP